MNTVNLYRRLQRVAVPVAILLLLSVVVLGARSVWSASDIVVTAEFDQAKNVYVGDDVTVLGVPIGTVTAVEPGVESVVVEMTLDSGALLPADATATIVAPSLVSVRHVALGPVHEGGSRLTDGAVIPLARTAVPVEWDQIKDEIVRLTTALGPDGANSDGALSELLTVSADNLQGNGADLRTTIESLSEAMSTLADNGGSLFATVRNLQVFTEAIEQSDAQVAEFNARMAEVSTFLAEDRLQLQAALNGLETALPRVQTFLQDNGQDLITTLDELQDPAALLADNRQKMADILQVAPSTLSNFFNILDPDIPALTGAFAVPNMQTPAMFICSAVYSLGGTPAQCESWLEPIAQYLRLDNPPIGLSPIVRDGRENINPIRPSDDNPTAGQPSGGSAADIDLLTEIGRLTNGGAS